MTELPAVPAEVLTFLQTRAAARPMSRQVKLAAVKAITKKLQQLAPGHSVEFRVPPVAAVQIVAGPHHRRGTPPALVQVSVDTCIDLAIGSLTWEDGVRMGAISASGERSNLQELFPVFSSPPASSTSS